MPEALSVSAVSKRYGPTLALDSVTHGFEAGRIYALMGKNGSGKSTLVKLVAGVVTPDAGDIRVAGRPVSLAAPADAFRAGIVTVHQELSTVPALSVAENIFLGRLPARRRLGVDWIDRRALMTEARRLLADIGLDLDPAEPAGELSVGRQQLVEIAKAMAHDPRILLLDEPTSALASREVEQLFALMRRLVTRGVTMLYITHRMNELFEIADTCTVLRDGRLAGSVEMATATPDLIVEMMFGDSARAARPPRRLANATAAPVLEVRGLGRAGAFADVSFSVRPGEIVGIAGLLGSGRTEVLRAIFGCEAVDAGTVTLKGETIVRRSPKTMKRRGLGYTPENRKEAGLVQILPTHDNLCLASLSRIAPSGFISRGSETPFVTRRIADLGIKAGDPMNPVSSLSGGNQQKVVIGNWLNTEPAVLLFDEPSRGVDIKAREQIFDVISRLAGEGLGTVFVSSELEEVLEVADRVLVMRDGRIVAERQAAEISIVDLYRLCMGANDARSEAA